MKCQSDIHIAVLVWDNMIRSGVTWDWSKSTINDIVIIGKEIKFTSYHKASATCFSTSSEVLVPFDVKNKHEYSQFE